jgi:short-subunit dehydrogenase
MQHIVIIGASSLIAEHCARLWAVDAARLTLIGRSTAQLDRIAIDLKVRAPKSEIQLEVMDFLDHQQIASLPERLSTQGHLDVVLIAHGSLPDQKHCESNLELMRETLELNGISPLLFAEAFAKHMAAQKQGCIAVIGSVAGDRGRRSNYVYGAAKGLVDRYLEGMRHRFANSSIKIVTIKPGPTRTPMTTSLAVAPATLAEPDQVARDIVDGIAAGKTVIYTPGKWRLIMLIIRHLPDFIFNKMNI